MAAAEAWVEIERLSNNAPVAPIESRNHARVAIGVRSASIVSILQISAHTPCATSVKAGKLKGGHL